MTEPGVTLTDYALAVECAVFAAWIQRRATADSQLRSWFVAFFASASAAPLLGGTVHGFFLDERSLGQAILWPAALISIGVTALCAGAIAARLLFRAAAARRITGAVWALFVGYAVVVLLVLDRFWVAVAAYLPAACFLLVAFARTARRPGAGAAAYGAWGLALAFVAAAVQQLGIAVHPTYLNHNALYHVIQAGALLLIFLGTRPLLGMPARPGSE